MRLSKRQREAAKARTRAIIAEAENAIAEHARVTGEVVPGVNEADYLAVYADEITRRPIPNRAERRRMARSR